MRPVMSEVPPSPGAFHHDPESCPDCNSWATTWEVLLIRYDHHRCKIYDCLVWHSARRYWDEQGTPDAD